MEKSQSAWEDPQKGLNCGHPKGFKNFTEGTWELGIEVGVYYADKEEVGFQERK